MRIPLCLLILVSLLMFSCSEDNPVRQSGALRILTNTTGNAPDTDGYTITFDGLLAVTYPDGVEMLSNDTTILSDLVSGEIVTLTLTEAEGHCVVLSVNPRQILIPFSDTTNVVFNVECID